jgi:hypothetical protein
MGAKFSLYSEAKDLTNKLITIKVFGFVSQKMLGSQKRTIKDLIQFMLNLSQVTLGSKIENKLFII